MNSNPSPNVTRIAVVIDGDAARLEYLTALLREGGIDARGFDGVEKALAAMDFQRPPDLIVLDLQASGMEGSRFCRLLRSSEFPAFNHVPVLVSSAIPADEEKTDDILKQKSMERRLLLDTIDTQVWYLTTPDTYGAVNKAHADFLGFRPQDIAYKKLDEFLSKEVAEICKAGNEKVFKTGCPVHTEEWIPNARGKARLVKIAKTPKLDENGKVQFVVCAGTDITELRTSEQLFQRIFDTAPIGIELFDEFGRLTMANKACLDIFGVVDPAEITGFELFKDPNIGGEQLADLRAGKQVRNKFGFDFEIVRKAGLYRTNKGGAIDLDVLITPMGTGENFEPSGYLALVRDVSRRKRAEEALRRSEAKYRRLVENSPAVVYQFKMTSDGKFEFPFLSDMTLAITGVPAAEAEKDSSRLLNLIHPEDLRSFRKGVLESAESLLPYHARFRAFLDGQTVWIEARATPESASDGSVLWDGFFFDITKLKKMEEERLNFERRLQQIEKAESLSRMAEAVAHNFNNMLAVVVGNLELALQDLPATTDSAIVENISDANRAALRAAETSRLMLTFLGQAIGKPDSFDLSAVCRECLARLHADMPEKIALTIELPAAGPVVRANPTQIVNVLSILVANACESIPAGEPGKVKVSVENAKAGEIRDTHRYPMDWKRSKTDYACIKVSDTGNGMDEAVFGRIFDPFYTTKFTGRGLGLPVALGIVKSSGGCVTVESELGLGSVFRVFLPSLPEAAVETNTANREENSFQYR